MARFFQPARNPGHGAAAPSIQSIPYTTGQTFKKGAVLIFASTGLVSEAGADPITNIAGVALEAAGSRPGFNPANADQVLQVTGIGQEVSVALADSKTVFSGRLKSAAGGDPTLPTLTMVNEEYGLTTVSGIWVIDLDEVTAKSIRIVDVDIDQKIAFFVFRAAVILLT